MHILIIIPEKPLPINSGGRIRTWNFIKALSPSCRMSLLYPVRVENDQKFELEDTQLFENVWPIFLSNEQKNISKKQDTSPTFKRRVINFVQNLPWEISNSFYKNFEDQFLQILQQNQFDAIFIRYFNNAQYFFRNYKKIQVPVFIDFDDIIPLIIQRFQEQDGYTGLYDKLRKRLNLHFWNNYCHHLKKGKRCFVCSEHDRQYVLKKSWTDKLEIVPNAIDVSLYQVDQKYSPLDFSRKTLLFCGHLNYQPNVNAIKWFIDDILPLIKQKEPHIKVKCIGSNPGEKIKKIKHDPSVTYYYDVPSVVPFYQEASIFIVPIQFGGGTRIKILEALASHRPVVTTSAGAEGLDLIHNTHCVIADQAQDFADACVDLLNNYEKIKSLTEQGFHFVCKQYDITRVAHSIQRIFGNSTS